MSKKSTGRCQSADSISSFRDAQSSARSSVSPSSTKGDSSANQECTSSSSIASLNHPLSEESPRRSSDESNSSGAYFNNLEYIRQKFSSNLQVEESYLFRPMMAFLDNDRWSPTRKSHSSRILSSICTLHIIEEKDECTGENSGETPKNERDCSTGNSLKNCDAENCRTPRFYEVPPKRLCTRPQTPRFDEFKNRRNHSKQLRLNLDNLSLKEPSSNSSSFFNKNKRASSNYSSESNLRMHLPSSVIEEAKPEMPPIEPKIIILDSGWPPKRKTKRKDWGKGDCFSDSEESGGVLKRYCECTPEISTNSTPTYTVSPVLTDRANQTDSFTTCYYRNRIYSQTELDEVEIKTVEPEPEVAMAQAPGNFKSINDEGLQSLKSLIVDYAEGVKITRTFPDNFQDIKDDKMTSSFKAKGTELLQAACTSPKSHSVTQELSNYDEADKDGDLIEARKNQVTDLDYYVVASTSSDDEENEENRAGLQVEDILLEEHDKLDCCSCFNFGRFIPKLTMSSK